MSQSNFASPSQCDTVVLLYQILFFISYLMTSCRSNFLLLLSSFFSILVWSCSLFCLSFLSVFLRSMLSFFFSPVPSFVGFITFNCSCIFICLLTCFLTVLTCIAMSLQLPTVVAYFLSPCCLIDCMIISFTYNSLLSHVSARCEIISC